MPPSQGIPAAGLARVADDAADAADAQAIELSGGPVEEVDAGQGDEALALTRGAKQVVVAADAGDPAEALGERLPDPADIAGRAALIPSRRRV